MSDLDRLGRIGLMRLIVAAFQEEVIQGNGVHKPKAGGNRPAVAIYGLK